MEVVSNFSDDIFFNSMYPLIEIDNVPNFFFLVLQHYIVNLMHGCLKKKIRKEREKKKRTKETKEKLDPHTCVFL